MNKKGFTLIELIVTIGLLIILFSIVGIRIDTDRYYLEKLSKELLYDIKDIKVKNMTSDGPSYSLFIYPDFYSLRKGTNTGMKEYKRTRLKEGYMLYFGSQNSSDHILFFNHIGRPNKAQTITIKKEESEIKKQITIVPVTGRVLLIN